MRQRHGRALIAPAARYLLHPAKQLGVEKGPGRDYNGTGLNFFTTRQPQAGHATIVDQHFLRLADDNRHPGRPNRRLHRGLVQGPIGLDARSVHRTSLAAVEHSAMDRRLVSRPCHQTIEHVELAHQMTLADSTDRRVAAHLANVLGAEGD